LDLGFSTKNKSPTTLEHTRQAVMCWDLAKTMGVTCHFQEDSVKK